MHWYPFPGQIPEALQIPSFSIFMPLGFAPRQKTYGICSLFHLKMFTFLLKKARIGIFYYPTLFDVAICRNILRQWMLKIEEPGVNAKKKKFFDPLL